MTSTAPESPTRTPRRRRRWIRVVGAVGLLAVVAALLLPTVLSSGWVRGKVETAASEALDTEVGVGELEFGWSSGVRLADLRIAQPEGFGGPDDLLSLGTLTGDVGLLGLLTGKLSLTGRVDGLVLQVVQKADGTVNLQRLGKGTSDGSEPGGGEPGAGSGELDLAGLRLDLDLRNARLEILHEEQGVLERMENVTASVSKPFGTQSIRLSFAADLAHGEGGGEPGRLALEADVQASRSAPVEAQLTCAGLDLARYRPLVEGFTEPGAVDEFAGEVEADVQVRGVPTERLIVEGLIEVRQPRLAGSLFRGMRIASPVWRLEPGVEASVPISGEQLDLDLSGLHADLGFLKLDGLAEDDSSRAGVKIALDVAALAEFGGPLPEFLKGSGLAVQGDLRVPLQADLAGTPLDELIRSLGVDLQITSESLQFAGQSVVGLAADLRLDQGAASLTTTAGRFDGGALQLKVSADASRLADADLTIEAGVDGAEVVGSAVGGLQYVAPFLAGLGEAAPNAVLQSRMTASVALEGPVLPADGEAWLAWLNRWTGDGDVALREGSFVPAPELSGLLQMVGQEQRVRFSDFSTEFKLRDGFVETGLSKLAAAGKEFGITGRTSLSGEIDHTIDARAMLMNHRDGARVLEYLGDVPIGAQLVGTLSDPKLALPDVQELIQQGLKNALQKEGAERLRELFGGDKKDGEAPDSPEDALRKGAEDLLRGVLGGDRKKQSGGDGGKQDGESSEPQPDPEEQLKRDAADLLRGILGGKRKTSGA